MNRDLDSRKMYIQTENKLLSKVIQNIYPKLKKYRNSSQSQRSKSNVTTFQPPLAFTMGHIPTNLHQFLFSIFRDFVQLQTDSQTPPKTIPACSIHAGKNKITNNYKYTLARRNNQQLLKLTEFLHKSTFREI